MKDVLPFVLDDPLYTIGSKIKSIDEEFSMADEFVRTGYYHDKWARWKSDEPVETSVNTPKISKRFITDDLSDNSDPKRSKTIF